MSFCIIKTIYNTGSLLIRIFDLSVDLKNHLVGETIINYSERLLGSFAVLTSKKLRIRKYNL